MSPFSSFFSLKCPIAVFVLRIDSIVCFPQLSCRAPCRLSARPANALNNPQYASQLKPPTYGDNGGLPPPPYQYVDPAPPGMQAPPPPTSPTPSGYQMPLQPLASSEKKPTQPTRTPEEEYAYANNVYEELDAESQMYVEPNNLNGVQAYMDLTV